MSSNFKIQTFGCKVNSYDSGLIRERLLKKGFQEGEGVIIFNTCAVTAEAGKEALRQARKIKRENPNYLIVVTGCGAQVETAMYERSKDIDLVIANSHKQDLPQILEQINHSPIEKKVFKSNIFKSGFAYTGNYKIEPSRTRAFLKIQDGCNSFCTFCIIPFARGRSQSFPVSQILESINEFLNQRVKEIVLTGVHIGDYESSGKNLGDLVYEILLKTKVPRLRLSSLEPIELTDKLMESYQDPRMCPHFHLSIQSCSSSVLKGMRRQYDRKAVEGAFLKIAKKVPKAFVGMDVIAGFPSESQQDFEETYAVLKSSPWTRIHVFPYSPRSGTFSARKPGLMRREIVTRASQLRALSEDRYKKESQKQMGSIKEVLFLKSKKNEGLSRDYWRVRVPHRQKSQTILQVQIDHFNESLGVLTGTPITYPCLERAFTG